MSKLIKKVFKAVKKVASGVKTFVKKHWKKIAVAALVVFTAGAASVVAAGGTWGGALTSVGSTFSAGASALTGGAIGTSAATAAGNAATAASLAAGEGTAMAGIQGGLATEAATAATASAGGVAGAINGAATSVGSLVGKAAGAVGAGGTTAAPAATAGTTAGTTAAAGGMGVGKAMLIGTGVQAAGALYNGYEQKKAEEEAKKEQENASYYGMNGKGEYAGGFSADGVDRNLQPAYQNYQPQNPNAQLNPRPTLLNRAAYQPIRTV